MNKIKIRCKTSKKPVYSSLHASGADVHAALSREVVLNPGERFIVPTGLYLEIPPGYEVQVRPRSGLAAKQGITVLNTPGTIDADYRGEVKIILINLGQESYTIEPNARIAQMVVAPVVQAEFIPVAELQETKRSSGGFGSTGI